MIIVIGKKSDDIIDNDNILDSDNNEIFVIANEPIQCSTEHFFIQPTISPEEAILETLLLTSEERGVLELATRKQSDCYTWHEA